MTNRSNDPRGSTTRRSGAGTRLAAMALLTPLLAALIPGATAAADVTMGRQLVGEFCTNPQALPKPGACLSLTFDGQTVEGYTDSPNRTLDLRPGTYWLSVNDESTAHNFSLETPDGLVQDITGIADTPGWVTIKVRLTHGSYTLFCDADDHRADGMYVQIDVGGVGQVG
jgi:hypothetical protein